MVATFALALALLGSAFSDVLLPPVVINGRRVQPNEPFQVQSSSSSFAPQPTFGSQSFRPSQLNVLVQPLRNFQASPDFAPQPPLSTFQAAPAAPQPPLRTFQAAPAFAPQLPSSRFQSDFAAPQTSFAVPAQTSFAAQAQPSFGPSPSGFRIQNDFVSQTPQSGPIVVSRVHQQDERGSYSNEYTTSDGQGFREVGHPKATADGQDVVIVKSGHYSYTSPEGVPVSVSYEADEQGFRANSNNIPK